MSIWLLLPTITASLLAFLTRKHKNNILFCHEIQLRMSRLYSKTKAKIKLFSYALKQSDQLPESEVLLLTPQNAHFLKVANQFYIPQLDHLALGLKKANISANVLIYPGVDKPEIAAVNPIFQINDLSLLQPSLKKYWTKVIKLAKPKIIAGIGLPQALLQVAKKNKVRTVEISHGFGIKPIDNYAPSYRQQYADKEPFMHIVNDTISYQTMTMCEVAKIKQTVHPYKERRQFFLEKNIDNQAILNKKIKKTFAEKQPIILITLQWGYAGDHPYFTGILKNGLIHEYLIKIIKNRTDINWIIRWHPVQIFRQQYQKELTVLKNLLAGNKHVAIEGFNFDEIIDIIKTSNIQISMSSMTTVEAGLLGVPSICLCPSLSKSGVNSGYFSELFASGKAKKVELNLKEIEGAIDYYLKNPLPKNHNFFKKDPNMPTTLETLLDLYNQSI